MPSPWHACGWHSCRARGGDRVSAGCGGRWFARSAGTPDGGGASCIARSPPRWRHRGRRTARSCHCVYNHGSWCRRGPLDRQPRLGAVERLDLALLVDTQHHRLARRAQVEAEDILDFVDKSLVIRQLRTAHKMRLEPACVPNLPHTGLAEADGLGHRPGAPLGCRRGFSCTVLSTTCAITSGASGGLRPGRLASRLSPAIPCAT